MKGDDSTTSRVFVSISFMRANFAYGCALRNCNVWRRIIRDAGGDRWRGHPQADPREDERPHDGEIGRTGSERCEHEHRRPDGQGTDDDRRALAQAHGQVARDRRGEREGQRSGYHHHAHVRLAQPVNPFEQHGRQDEASHVAEVGEDLNADGEGEVAPAQVGKR